ncbi:multidrug efflux SMR transporter [Streptomyces luomodiensis]|uniref:Multidrug efflux SMR transporter n=1 Tax=Streptomyces luomodiensis TaxID=3026192 RepID=A0ABY9V7T3_9ACTN|nr:multidrug efflux SMR transporter [Streptomyces sp. SCA4-21]WNE98064.1 multidrug efflux SMR transporter [Streptomyces sp. SCA4-21]
MAWVLLLTAGLFEICWSIGMKLSDGFTRLWPSVITVAGLIVSMGLLSVAVRSLPIGTAYGVWVGIGAVGTALLGMVLFHEPVTPARVFFLLLLVVAIVGLEATAGE